MLEKHIPEFLFNSYANQELKNNSILLTVNHFP
jgi:hypothetical protein